MGEKREAANEYFLKLRVKGFDLPPIKDGLVLGKSSPIGLAAIRKALSLLISNQFAHIEVKGDEVISDIIIRTALLRKVPEEELVDFILRRVKPLMDEREILQLDMDVEVLMEEGL